MAREQLKTLTEPMYYLLLALTKSQHGYSIMQSIQDISGGRVKVGAGTLYNLLSRFEAEQIISQIAEENRKKIYALTDKGRQILSAEYLRLHQMTKDGRRFFNDDGTVIPSGPFSGEALLVEESVSSEESSQEDGSLSESPQRHPDAFPKQPSLSPGLRRKGVLV